MTLGQRLRQLRMRKKLSMQELSDDLNKMFPNTDGVNSFGKGKISKWEAGKVDPAVSSIAKVAKYFDVSLDYLLGLEDENTHYPVVEVPILKGVYQGVDLYEHDNIVGHYYIPNNLKISHQKLAYLRLTDTKMVLINFDDEVKNDEIGLFIVDGQKQAVLRKIQYINDYVVLIPSSSNSNVEPKIYKNDDVKTIGKLVSTVDYSNGESLDF